MQCHFSVRDVEEDYVIRSSALIRSVYRHRSPELLTTWPTVMPP